MSNTRHVRFRAGSNVTERRVPGLTAESSDRVHASVACEGSRNRRFSVSITASVRRDPPQDVWRIWLLEARL
ncbi:hypothetical protein BCY88_29210 [Paraburkholderia fungorum]|uniref:Uncharacterized protein n=1 Tax=Paraburkholderia fungorum TaxID=134537 RepID=A0A420GGF0_9BURK|nr:hypothetical protein BCY88_29210 [Paraburkholderia fungorum]